MFSHFVGFPESIDFCLTATWFSRAKVFDFVCSCTCIKLNWILKLFLFSFYPRLLCENDASGGTRYWKLQDRLWNRLQPFCQIAWLPIWITSGKYKIVLILKKKAKIDEEKWPFYLLSMCFQLFGILSIACSAPAPFPTQIYFLIVVIIGFIGTLSLSVIHLRWPIFNKVGKQAVKKCIAKLLW